MTTQAMHHQLQQQPQPYLQHQHQQQAVPPGVSDDRSTSPTVMVTTSQVIKEGVDSTNPSPSTAPVSSTNTTPLSGAGAAAAVYAAFPNPVQSYYQQSGNNNNVEKMDGTVTSTAARPTTPFQYHHPHSGSGEPLSSPMSAPPFGAWKNAYSSAPPSTNHTPVPSEIHTTDGEDSRGPMPFFPSVFKSSANSSNNSISSKGTNNNNSCNSTKSVQVTGKKKHLVKSSASATSLSSNHPEDEWLMTMESGAGGGAVVVTARRQKRLERNRESARLSRRRRKQYLEVLEERVAHLSLEMDQGRRHHANQAIASIRHQRSQVVEQALAEVQQEDQHSTSKPGLVNSLWLLEEGALARTSSALLVLSTFYTQQLKSFSLPSECKFTLWLTLQGDPYFRGGRAASERLSAARIGERMLANGNDKVTPTNSMWPLVCNEIGLSYDQEERVRQYQRTVVLQDPSTWLDRHTARASSLVMQSFHDAVGAMSNVLRQREHKVKQILTPQQRIKFLSWAIKNADRNNSRFLENRQEEENRRCAMTDSDGTSYTDSRDQGEGGQETEKYQLDKANHVAANLYILNHRLQNVLKESPFQPPFVVTPSSLKKLSRRPSFESLGQQRDAEGRGLSRDTSFASIGSLKTTTSNLSLGGVSTENLEKMAQANQITPEDGEQAAASTVEEFLGFVKPIIPSIPPVRMVALPPVCPIPGQTAQYMPASSTVPPFACQPPAAPVNYGHYAPPPAPVMTAPQAQQYPAPPSYPGQEVVQFQQLPPVEAIAAPTYTYQQQQPQVYQQSQGQYYAHPAPQDQSAPTHYVTQPSVFTPVPSPLDSLPPVIEPAPTQQPPAPAGHTRKSSFLPLHLNVVPEDMFPGGDSAAEDFFVGLMDDEEDWAIGEGVDMDTTS